MRKRALREPLASYLRHVPPHSRLVFALQVMSPLGSLLALLKRNQSQADVLGACRST